MLCLFGFCEAISCLGFTRGRRRGEGKLSRSKERHCGGNVSSCAKRLDFVAVFWPFDCLFCIMYSLFTTHWILIGNSISTTKYNFITFLPKGLFEQLYHFAMRYA
ncbi:hypothetical protein PS1_008437 [Malus domestica]